MAWTAEAHDTSGTHMMKRGGCSSNEKLVPIFGVSSVAPLRGLRVSYKPPFCSDRHKPYEDNIPEDSSRHVEKKRRLTAEQVKSLELSFERENKLEPERKQKLANDLGLRPRQVAVWFQNRRARWKTKQLEQDFDILKSQYDSVVMEREKLLAEVSRLTTELQATQKHDAHGKNEEKTRSDIAGFEQVLDPTESKALLKQSPLDSDYTDTVDSDSPFSDNTMLLVQEAVHNSRIQEMDTLHQVETPGFRDFSDAVNQSRLYLQAAKSEETTTALEEPYNSCIFTVDDVNSAWLWML